jgi:hypothetical protein
MKKWKAVIVFTVVLMFCLVPVSAGYLDFDGGGVEEINYYTDQDVRVGFNDPSDPSVETHLDIVTDGDVVSEYIKLFNNSSMTLNGGKVQGIWAFGNSQVNIISGDIRHHVAFWGDSEASIHGGVFEGGFGSTSTADLTIFGGNFNAGALYANADSTITIHGTFNYAYGTLTEINDSANLVGVLSNGDPIDVNLSINDNGTFILVPEPTTLLLLGLGAIAFRKKS